MSPFVIPQIKYIVMYETTPVSGIRWFGKVQSIKPHGDTGKFEVVLSEREKLQNPVMLTPEEAKRGLAPRSPRYTRFDLFKDAKKLDDVF